MFYARNYSTDSKMNPNASRVAEGLRVSMVCAYTHGITLK
jgi:hypothetical protein